MSYAMSLLKQEISRRMNGECRVNVQTGSVLRMDGDRMESCGDCPAYCMGGNRRAGLVGPDLQIETITLGEGRARLAWDCPGCGRETTEDSTVLRAPSHAKEIEVDPLCHTCRTNQTKAGA